MAKMNEIQKAMTWGCNGLPRKSISLNRMARAIAENYEDVSWCPEFGRNIVCLHGDGDKMCEIVWMNRAHSGMMIREATCPEN